MIALSPLLLQLQRAWRPLHPETAFSRAEVARRDRGECGQPRPRSRLPRQDAQYSSHCGYAHHRAHDEGRE